MTIGKEMAEICKSCLRVNSCSSEQYVCPALKKLWSKNQASRLDEILEDLAINKHMWSDNHTVYKIIEAFQILRNLITKERSA